MPRRLRRLSTPSDWIVRSFNFRCDLMRVLVAAWFVGCACCVAAADEPSDRMELLRQSQRIVFLGDSITASGRYVANFDAWLATKQLDPPPIVIDAGLASETVSGLSEDGHAGGKFPRPDLFERLDRVLDLTKPDLVFACYGINCGIYLPFDEYRFAKYQEGIRRLKSKVEAVGAKLIVITPPFYDDLRKPGAFSYNAVLDQYAAWLLSQRAEGWHVVDLHDAMTAYMTRRRANDPQFTMQPDAVHPNEEGHWFMTQQLLHFFGDDEATATAGPTEMLTLRQVPTDVLGLAQQRTYVLRDAYVAAAGHQRPGVAQGLPLAEALEKYQTLSRELKQHLSPK